MDGQPQQWNPSQVGLVILTLVMVGSLSFSIDHSVANWVNNGERIREVLSGDGHALIRLSEVFAHGIAVILIILVVVRVDCRGWRVFPFLAAPSLGAGIAADLCKLVINRTRPSKYDFSGDVFGSFGAWFPTRLEHDVQSFPSAHTAVAVGFAIALTRLYPRGRPLFLLFAVMASLQRIESGAHYVSDVVFGATVGVLVSAITTHWLSNLVFVKSWKNVPVAFRKLT